MPEMIGVALMIDMLAKTKRKEHEFEELRHRNTLTSKVAAAAKRLRMRWAQ
ncbi:MULTISPECIES: hypothetical protein [unclassified Rhizobium]|uniref:hypothetical protein n=1 Tax=unclassified Rhizobium TaxID=2613769 RepID=UPI000AB0D3AC|nr:MULTISPECIES: hypothetical protein [unclassified Rhizobium]